MGGGEGKKNSYTSSPVLVSYMCQLSVKGKGADCYNMPLNFRGKRCSLLQHAHGDRSFREKGILPFYSMQQSFRQKGLLFYNLHL